MRTLWTEHTWQQALKLFIFFSHHIKTYRFRRRFIQKSLYPVYRSPCSPGWRVLNVCPLKGPKGYTLLFKHNILYFDVSTLVDIGRRDLLLKLLWLQSADDYFFSPSVLAYYSKSPILLVNVCHRDNVFWQKSMRVPHPSHMLNFRTAWRYQ